MPGPESTIPAIIDQHGETIRTMRDQGCSYESISRATGLTTWMTRQAALQMGEPPAPKGVRPRAAVVATTSAPSVDELDALVSDGDTADLIESRIAAFRRKAKHGAQRTHRIERDGPWAVCHLGDPHVDDDGCDWPELIRTIKTIRKTPQMYAGNVGDTTNNWVGRLEALYKHQSTTESDALRLAEWLIQAVEWDYIVLGNHDHWNQGSTIARLFARQAKIVALEDHEARVEYVVGGEVVTRLLVRHDFKGGSMWHEVHGGIKRAKMRPWGDVLVSGHHHTWGHHAEEHDGRVFDVIKVRGFKRYDSYAQSHDYPEVEHGCSVTTVHVPTAAPAQRVTVWRDVEEAADYLGWVRSR